jgi:hypothetical protein
MLTKETGTDCAIAIWGYQTKEREKLLPKFGKKKKYYTIRDSVTRELKTQC